MKKFICNNCDFQCSKKSNWLLHMNTAKHINKVNECYLETEKMPDDKDEIMEKMKIFYHCECGKIYVSRAGVWKHKKKCDKEIKKVMNQPIEDETTEEAEKMENIENKVKSYFQK